MTMTAPKKTGRPRIRVGIECNHLDPPSLTTYKRGCPGDACKDVKADYAAANRRSIQARNEEIREYVRQIRERMGV